LKVRCIQIRDIRGQLVDSVTDSRTTIGNIYDVLSVEEAGKGRIHYRVLEDDRTSPILIPKEQFEIADGNIPRNWIISIKNGSFFLGPEKWSYASFWSDYFDGEAASIQFFKDELEKI
jgi:hypothetical protein